MKYEEALEKLNNIKEELDSPSITLDDSVKLYEESVKYTKICLDLLKETEGKIAVIKTELDSVIEKPLSEIKE